MECTRFDLLTVFQNNAAETKRYNIKSRLKNPARYPLGSLFRVTRSESVVERVHSIREYDQKLYGECEKSSSGKMFSSSSFCVLSAS